MVSTREGAESELGRRRPVGITVLLWFGVVQGLFLVVVGGVVIAVRGESDPAAALETNTGLVLAIGVALVVMGLVRLGLAVALGRGSELVRSLFGAVATLQAGAAVYSLVALRDVRQASIGPLVFATVELWLLYGSVRTQEFFRR